jgi:hypothetical protein
MGSVDVDDAMAIVVGDNVGFEVHQRRRAEDSSYARSLIVAGGACRKRK